MVCYIIAKLNIHESHSGEIRHGFFVVRRENNIIAKSIMRNATDIDNRIKEQLASYKQWEALADEFEDGVLMNIAEDSRTELIDLIMMKKNIEDIIMSFHRYEYRQILRMRYLENLPWECIADEMNEDVTWVKKQHHKALKKVHLEITHEEYDNAEEV